jgi:hypothetical protein
LIQSKNICFENQQVSVGNCKGTCTLNKLFLTILISQGN